MVAALRNLQIAVVARGELQPAPVVPKTGNQIDERTLRRRRGVVNGVDDLLILMRAGDGEHVEEAGADDVGFAAHAAGDADAARPDENTSEPPALMSISYA